MYKIGQKYVTYDPSNRSVAVFINWVVEIVNITDRKIEYKYLYPLPEASREGHLVAIPSPSEIYNKSFNSFPDHLCRIPEQLCLE